MRADQEHKPCTAGIADFKSWIRHPVVMTRHWTSCLMFQNPQILPLYNRARVDFRAFLQGVKDVDYTIT